MAITDHNSEHGEALVAGGCGGTAEPQSLADEAALVERCIRGDVAAWEELYHKCHEPLCATIRFQLGRSSTDPHLVDELAARVWYALVDQDGQRLTKFDVHRGSILTFIRLIARRETAGYFRAERRRLKKELSGVLDHNRQATISDRGESLSTILGEFLTSLTPRERAFCHEYLQIAPGENKIEAATVYSSANIWQLTRRIYKKFREFFDMRR